MFSSDYRFVGGAGDRAFDAALPAKIDGVFRFLAKGLVEFIERLQFQQSYATAPAPVRDLDNIARLHRSGRLPALRRFLAMDRDDWNRLGNDIAYPYAWSLVYYLLKDPRHGPLLSAYLNTLAQHRCRPFDHAGSLDLNYPGGLDRLAADWRTWLTQGQAAALTHFGKSDALCRSWPTVVC